MGTDALGDDRQATAALRADVYVGVLDLFSRYCFALDGSDADALADCFLPDGVLEIVGRSRFVGREAVAALVRDTEPIRSTRPRHFYHNLWIVATDGTRATAKAYFSLIDPVNGENASLGHYEDDVVLCEDGMWRWRLRSVVFAWDAKPDEPKPGDQLPTG